MKSVNFVVLGDSSIAQELGKKGSVTSVTLYDRKFPDRIVTFAVPSGFPEKIQSLVQAIAMAEYAILNVTQIDKSLGEQIVALESMGMERGFIVANGLDEEIRKIARSTILEKYRFVAKEELTRIVEEAEPVRSEGNVKVIVDQAFEVKGVGTVVLGVVRRGTLKKHDELELLPAKKMIQVRSIQMHDDDVESSESPGRVGIAIKGATAEEIERGDVMAAKGNVKSGIQMEIKFAKNRFYRGELSPSLNCHMCVGLQARPVKISIEDGTFKVVSERPFAYESGEGCILLDLNSTSVRIVGNGTIV